MFLSEDFEDFLRVILPEKLVAKKTLYICSVFRRYGEFLLNERRYGQSAQALVVAIHR